MCSSGRENFTNTSLLPCLATASLITFAALLPANHASSQVNANDTDTVTINLKDVDIHTLITTVSQETGKNFIVDPRVSAKVTVISSGEINSHKLYDLFLSVLDVHGFAAVPADEFIKIVPAATGVQSAVPVVTDQTGNVDELVTKVIHVVNVPVQQLTEALRPLLPASATLGAEPNSNALVVTDRAANIERLTEIVRELDRPK